jgi:hypothetical protein
MEKSKTAKVLSPASTAKVIDALGGTAAVSRMTDVSTAAVAMWRHRGMPKYRLQYLRERFKELPVMHEKEVREL